MPARQRWARRLWWTALALTITVGVASRLLDSLPVPSAHASVVPSVLYDRYGTPIAEIGPSVPHASLGLEDMAPALADALVAVLDPSFLASDGVDADAYVAALRRIWSAPDAARDGITHRYLTAVHRGGGGALHQARLWLAELRLGRQLSRPEILERFANSVYLGRGAYGVHAAAAAWYGTTAAELTVTQSAYLASLIDAPGGVDTASGPDHDRYRSARVRRDRVLTTMADHGMLTPNELAVGRTQAVTAGIRPATAVAAAASEPRLPALGAGDNAASGFVRILIPAIGLETAVGQAYVELVGQYGVLAVVTGGLHVTTSLDMPAQRFAAQAVRAQVGSALTSGAAADIAVLDRSGDVRVLLNGKPIAPSNTAGSVDDVENRLGPRQLGDVLGPATNELGTWIARTAMARDVGTVHSAEVVAQAADAATVAAAFSVAATGGEERTSRIVLAASDRPPSGTLLDGDAQRWPMRAAAVLDSTVVDELRTAMSPLTLASGATALGRGGHDAGTGDTWFAGWTSHYTAAVVLAAPPALGGEAAAAANELFAAVLDSLHGVG
ncbi:transglycosylase domain-containing protein [Candidatus Poriferisodalis sp.]|uniref:transglycosylase domain-containing protein n=1 Tax=Candidatus Poriferisodalis sp. TaxID=3101277 RepID=UPI003B0130DA